MDRAKMIEIARSNVESNLGNCFEVEDEPDADSIFNEAYTLALDALYDNAEVQASCEQWGLSSVATEVATSYALP